MRKGAISPAVWLFAIMFVVMFLFVGMVWYQQAQLAVRPVAVKYEGEFDDGFLATKGWFGNDFAEQTDCNITDDKLGWKIDGSCVYDTIKALNSTADSSVDSRDWEFAWVMDIDDDVEYLDVSVELVGDAQDYLYIKDAKIYTHEDNPQLVFDLQPYIEDHTEIDAKTGPLEGDEYVLWIVFHTKQVDEHFSAGENIAEINLKIGTSGDVDEAYVTVENYE